MTALFGIHPENLILPLMYAAIGFLLAALIALTIFPAIHRRAERLTKRRLQDLIPQNVQELRAEKDHLRAQHAVETRDLTLGLEKLREKAARQSAELGRRTAEANRLKMTLQEKDHALAEIKRRAAGLDDGSDGLRAAVGVAQFEAQTARAALRDAERAIMTLQAEIAELTQAVESRSHLIDRQQHDIMALSAQIERISKAPPEAAPVIAQAALAKQKAQPAVQAAIPAPARPAPPTTAPAAATRMVSFESRLAAIRDDKPLRDVRPQALVKRKVEIESAPQSVKALLAPPVTRSAFLNELIAQAHARKAAQKPASAPQPPAQADPEPARVATDIRYDEPLTTSDLLELGKAMLRQSDKAGPPHKTH